MATRVIEILKPGRLPNVFKRVQAMNENASKISKYFYKFESHDIASFLQRDATCSYPPLRKGKRKGSITLQMLGSFQRLYLHFHATFVLFLFCFRESSLSYGSGVPILLSAASRNQSGHRSSSSACGSQRFGEIEYAAAGSIGRFFPAWVSINLVIDHTVAFVIALVIDLVVVLVIVLVEVVFEDAADAGINRRIVTSCIGVVLVLVVLTIALVIAFIVLVVTVAGFSCPRCAHAGNSTRSLV